MKTIFFRLNGNMLFKNDFVKITFNTLILLDTHIPIYYYTKHTQN